MGIEIDFGGLVKEVLKKQAGTIEEEASRIGYTLPGINKIFEKKDINTSILKKVCKVYNLDMGYFLTGNTYITQKGKNVLGESNNVAYGKFSNVETNKVPDAELLLVRSENESLKRENALLREMVDMLKSRG